MRFLCFVPRNLASECGAPDGTLNRETIKKMFKQSEFEASEQDIDILLEDLDYNKGGSIQCSGERRTRFCSGLAEPVTTVFLAYLGCVWSRRHGGLHVETRVVRLAPS
jgi:hypothetical protein